MVEENKPQDNNRSQLNALAGQSNRVNIIKPNTSSVKKINVSAYKCTTPNYVTFVKGKCTQQVFKEFVICTKT